MTGRNQLHTYRLILQTTQSNMAHLMGIALRTYEELEAGRTAIRELHLNAARYACIKRVIEVGSGVVALPPDVAADLDQMREVLEQN